MDVIVLGSINYDLMISVDKIPSQGETIHGYNYLETIGGKGSNQAVAAARLGVETLLIGTVGDDLHGKKSLEEINKSGVLTKYVKESKEYSTGTAFIISTKNDNRIIVNEGANGHLDNTYVDILNNSNNSIFLTQLENPIPDVEKAIKLAKMNNNITVFNPAPAKVINRETFKYIDYFIVNQTEAEFYTEIYPTNEQEYLKVGEKLIKLGVTNVVITLGADGCFFKNNIESQYIPGFEVDVVDTTGAGDTFIGGFIYGLSKRLNIKESLKHANGAGALACLKYGAKSSMPNEKELKKIMNIYKKRSV